MQLTGIKQGDVVRVDHGGRKFMAWVDAHNPRIPGNQATLAITPITGGITWREAKASEIVGHYRRSKQSTDHLGKGLT